MLRSAFLTVAVASLALGFSAPASANAAMTGAIKAPAAANGIVIDVRRGGRGFRGRGIRGGRAFHRGRAFRGGRAFGGGRAYRRYGGARRHWRPRRRYYSSGIYFAAPYVLYRSYGYGECRWLRRKAVRTGSGYWWRRYRRCVRYYY